MRDMNALAIPATIAPGCWSMLGIPRRLHPRFADGVSAPPGLGFVRPVSRLKHRFGYCGSHIISRLRIRISHGT